MNDVDSLKTNNAAATSTDDDTLAIPSLIMIVADDDHDDNDDFKPDKLFSFFFEFVVDFFQFVCCYRYNARERNVG